MEGFYPGFRNSVCSYAVGLLNPKVVEDLGLYGQWTKDHRAAAGAVRTAGKRDYMKQCADPQRMQVEVARHSEKDAANLEDFFANIERLADLLRSFVLETPPNAGGHLGDLWTLWKSGRRIQGLSQEAQQDLADIFVLSGADYLDHWFENDAVKT